jgi:DnaK suppressor protein
MTQKTTATKQESVAAKAASKPEKKMSALEGFGKFEPYQEKPGEEYMNPDQEAHFRAILQAWRKELMEEVDRTVHHMKDEAANFPDPNDRATQESEFSMELRARDRERKLLKKIGESLDALDEGEYGFCEGCGVEIGIRRLEARPTATLCIDCKTLDEIREKQRG